MAVEYKLSYTASEIDERLGRVDSNTTDIENLSENHSELIETVKTVDGKVAELNSEIKAVNNNITELDNKISEKVSSTTTVNGKSLTGNITLTATDVNADESGAATKALTDAKTYADGKIEVLEEEVGNKADADHTHVGQEEFSTSEPTKQVTGDYWMLSY